MGRAQIKIPEGTIFDRLFVVTELPSIARISQGKERFDRFFLCQCDCGTKPIRVKLSHLRSGHTNSCGCFKKQRTIESVTKHGQHGTPLYKCYQAMKQRCYNKKNKHYEDYGGRGITVCEEWLGLQGFDHFMHWNKQLPLGKRWSKTKQIDRENNDKGYSPKNCRWVTSKVNNDNKRNCIKIKGTDKTLSYYYNNYAHSSVTHSMAINRYRAGWSIMEAVSKPARGTR